MRLRDKVALITGAGSGMGRATAILFAREGAKVSVVDIGVAGGEETVRLIRQDGGTAQFIRADVSTAMEYWDLTRQFRSGHRLFARFLITNEGPGSHTGAAVGHLVLPTGAITPIKWGRTRDDWTISPDRRRLKIGKAVPSRSRTTSWTWRATRP